MEIVSQNVQAPTENPIAIPQEAKELPRRASGGHYNFTAEDHECTFPQLPAGKLQGAGGDFSIG